MPASRAGRKRSLIGQRFGRGTVIRKAGHNSSNNITWLVRCDCGNEYITAGSSLRTGNTKSCGCRLVEARVKNGKLKRKHGHTRNPERTSTYISWMSMRARCYNRKHEMWKRYGGRGIAVCERWLGEHGFENFLADMGPRPVGTTIDRFPNRKGNYEPTNCRWATPEQQRENQCKNTKAMQRARLWGWIWCNGGSTNRSN